MRIGILILMFLLQGCFYVPGPEYEIGTAELIAIHKTELGFDLTWLDSRKAVYLVSRKDTAGLKEGMIITTLVKK